MLLYIDLGTPETYGVIAVAAAATTASSPYPTEATSPASVVSVTSPTLPQSNPQVATAISVCNNTAVCATTTNETPETSPSSPKVAVIDVESHRELEAEECSPYHLTSSCSVKDERQQPSQHSAPESSVSPTADQGLLTPTSARSRLSIPSSAFSNLSLPKISRSTSSAATSVISFTSRPRSQSSVTTVSTSAKDDDDSRRNSTVSVQSLGNSSTNLASATPALQTTNSSPGTSKASTHRARSQSPHPPRTSRVLFQAAASSATASSSSPVSSIVSFSKPVSLKASTSIPLTPTSTGSPTSESPQPFLKRMIKLTRNKSVPASATDGSSPKALPMRKTSTNVFSSFPSLTLTRTLSDSKSIFSSPSNASSPKTSSKKKSPSSRSSSKTRSRSGSTTAQDQILVNRVISAIQRSSFITLSDMDLDVLIHAMQGKNAHVLEALNISAASISSSDAKVLARLIRSSEAANIKSIKMTRSTISQQASKLMFEAWKFNRTITTLQLSRSGVDDKTVKYLSRMLAKNETLATLDLSNNMITAVGIQMLVEALLVNRSITRLSLQSNNIRKQGAPHLASLLSRNRVIKHLNISSNALGPDGSCAIADAVRFNRTLISLAMDMNEVGVRGAYHLGVALRSNRHLTHLFLAHNNIGDDGVVHICEGLKRNEKLNVLDLELNNIGQAQNVIGLMRLGEVLKTNTTLRELNLAYNVVSAEAVHELTLGLIENSTLESIILTNCRLTEDSAKSLAKVLTSPKTGLQNLSLSSNPDIGVDGYWALATAMVKNRSLKGIQLDYNSDDRQQLYDSIQNSVTRNHIWQQAIYSAACRILSLSRIVLLGRPGISREQYFGIDPSQVPSNDSIQRSTSMTSKQSTSWSGKILRRVVGRTNSSGSLASILSITRRDSHGPNHSHAIEGHSTDSQHQEHGHIRKSSISSVTPSIAGSIHGTIRPTHGIISGGPSHLATLTSPPSGSEAVSQQQQQQPSTPTSAHFQPFSHQLPAEYHYNRILPNLGDMPCEIFENICAFLDPGRCMTIAQVRATVREANNRSTLKASMTKEQMLEKIFKSRYISPMGTRYNTRPEDL
ncbi:hypothetical protein BGW42_001112 [Actinomortierella wolfii]|nr:hypothetical protein BGW42_001112 [Actinomortierella wolfii]